MRTALASAIALVTFASSAAFALEGPEVEKLFPRADGFARSVDVPYVTATYDRDLSEVDSNMRMRDRNGVQLTGRWFLSGPKFPTGGQHSISFQPDTALQEALSPYTVRAVAAPRGPGDTTITIWSFRIDDTPPARPTISSPSNGSIKTDQPVVARGTAEPASLVEIIENDIIIASELTPGTGQFSVTLPYPPEDGVSHTILAVAKDEAGNRSPNSASRTFRHDSIARIPVITQPVDGAQLNTTSVVVAGNAKPSTTVTIYRSGTPIGTTTADTQGLWSTTLGFAANTSHSITATANDGFVTDGPSAAVGFVVDTTAPARPQFQSPGAGAIVSARPVTVSGLAEPNSTVQLREAGLLLASPTVTASGTWSAQLSLTDGPHTLTARSVDAAGNLSLQAQRTFTIDTAAPSAPTITTPAEGAFVKTTGVPFSGTSEGNATVRILHGAVVVGSAVATATGTWSTTIPFSPDAAYTVTAVATDVAGNVGPASSPRSFSVDTQAPAAPVIVKPFEGQVFPTDAIDVHGTSEPGAAIDIIEGTSPIASTVADSSGEWQARITALADGSHTITAVATDIAGNTGPASAPRTFVIDPTTADTVPPLAPSITAPAQNAIISGMVIFKGTAEPASTVRVYEGGPSPIGSATTSGAGQWQVGVALSTGSHTVVADAVDLAGNVGPASPPRTFYVDTTRPLVSFTTPSETIFLPDQPTLIEGTASDSYAVSEIQLNYYDMLNTLVLTTTASCPACPTGTGVTWSDTPTLPAVVGGVPAPPVGIYRVEARAVDAAGNLSRIVAIRFIRL